MINDKYRTIINLKKKKNSSQVSGTVHKNGNIAGNGNSGSVSPRNPGNTMNRKRLSDQNQDASIKKRKVNDGEQPSVTHVGIVNIIIIQLVKY